MEYTQQLLEEAGLGADRLAMYEIAASDAPTFVAAVKEMTERVTALGPNPLPPAWGPEAVAAPKELEAAVPR